MTVSHDGPATAFQTAVPDSFALLSRDTCESMLLRCRKVPARHGWTAYVRVTGSQLLDLDVDFSVTDLDGHEIVLSERLDDIDRHHRWHKAHSAHCCNDEWRLELFIRRCGRTKVSVSIHAPGREPTHVCLRW